MLIFYSYCLWVYIITFAFAQIHLRESINPFLSPPTHSQTMLNSRVDWFILSWCSNQSRRQNSKPAWGDMGCLAIDMPLLLWFQYMLYPYDPNELWDAQIMFCCFLKKLNELQTAFKRKIENPLRLLHSILSCWILKHKIFAYY